MNTAFALRRNAGPLVVACLLMVPLHFAIADTDQLQAPSVDSDGTITGDLPAVPLSGFLSDEIKPALAEMLRADRPSIAGDGIEISRRSSAAKSKRLIAEWLQIHPARITETMIDGVRTHVVVPDAGISSRNKNRVLINAHGGGYMLGAEYGGQVESVPLAGYGQVKIIAVDYALAPENIHPAASEDMEAVYRHTLETTDPDNIGIFGCSAGGSLTAQMIPWLLKKGLPLPGAIGVFCSGVMPTLWFGGDSGATSSYLNGRLAITQSDTQRLPRNYYHEMDLNDPVITPGNFPEILAQFPPTLLVTGTRDVAMSNALITHARLLNAGVEANLFVQEGLGHGHMYMFPGSPESQTAYEIIWRFFDRHLGR
jgi:acetyl esterase/lipase